MKPFQPLHTQDTAIHQNFQDLKQLLDSLRTNPLFSGKLLTNFSLVSGTNTITHGLGYNYTSYLVSLPDSAITLTQGVSVDRSKFIVISASGPCHVTILVF